MNDDQVEQLGPIAAATMREFVYLVDELKAENARLRAVVEAVDRYRRLCDEVMRTDSPEAFGQSGVAWDDLRGKLDQLDISGTMGGSLPAVEEPEGCSIVLRTADEKEDGQTTFSEVWLTTCTVGGLPYLVCIDGRLIGAYRDNDDLLSSLERRTPRLAVTMRDLLFGGLAEDDDA